MGTPDGEQVGTRYPTKKTTFPPDFYNNECYTMCAEEKQFNCFNMAASTDFRFVLIFAKVEENNFQYNSAHNSKTLMK